MQVLRVKGTYACAPVGAGRTEPAHYLVLADKFITFQRPSALGPLTRDEYRAVLNRCGTVGEAMDALMK